MGSLGHFGRPQPGDNASVPAPAPVQPTAALETATLAIETLLLPSTATSTGKSNADCSNWGFSEKPVEGKELTNEELSFYRSATMSCIEWGGTPTPTLMQGTLTPDATAWVLSTPTTTGI